MTAEGPFLRLPLVCATLQCLPCRPGPRFLHGAGFRPRRRRVLEGGRRLTWGPGHGSHERPRLGMLGRAGRRVCGTFLALHCCPPPAERRTKVSKKTWIHPGQQEDPIASTRLRKGHHENAVGFCSRLAGCFLALDQGGNLINCLQNPVGLIL